VIRGKPAAGDMLRGTSMSWMVRLGVPLIMGTDPELALYGRYCISRRLQQEGFQFMFPDISTALNDLYATASIDQG
jgi:NAD dependent epimerase/dehydratase family enzyme